MIDVSVAEAAEAAKYRDARGLRVESQKLLFDDPTTTEMLELRDAEVVLVRGFLREAEGFALLDELRDSVQWREDVIRVFGKIHKVPRLQQWFGDPGTVYRWSGLEMKPRPWTPLLERIRRKVEGRLGARFNSLLLNLYRDGGDTVGWHADDEPTLGKNPTIASVSLGAERDFLLRHVEDTTKKHKVSLPHGSLLVMSGTTQEYWQHSLPRRKRVRTERLNMTFRNVVTQS